MLDHCSSVPRRHIWREIAAYRQLLDINPVVSIISDRCSPRQFYRITSS